MMNEYECPVCGNKNPKYFGMKKGKYYCRRCISFQGEESSQEEGFPKEVDISLDYELTEEQIKISNQIKEGFINKKNILVKAVCGAGKTEITFEVIKYAMSKGLHVGFAIPRRDVVIELLPRFSRAFPQNVVVAVYGGHHQFLSGDLIIITTHQLYRYPNYFDLLIVDEIDAFPFKGNDVLISIFKRSVRGTYLWMSATPSLEVIKEFQNDDSIYLMLDVRFHHQKIPVPLFVKRIGYLKVFFLIKKIKYYQKSNKPCLIFAPTIKEAIFLYDVLKCFVKNGNLVHSKCENRDEIIESFKKRRMTFLVTTSVLERGITIKNLQVIIYHSDHNLYDSHSLIQIAGRVGRKLQATDGEVIFLANKNTCEMQIAKREIEMSNTHLQNMF